jgi:hypothetical protein
MVLLEGQGAMQRVVPSSKSFGSAGWRVYWTIRLGFAVGFAALAGFGACFSMLSH